MNPLPQQNDSSTEDFIEADDNQSQQVNYSLTHQSCAGQAAQQLQMVMRNG